MRTIVAAILALAFYAGPAAAAPASEAEAAYDQAFAAMMADVGNLDKTFAFAAAAAAVEDFEGAVAALERMLLLRPDLPRVKLELGVLYFRLGSYQQARAYLRALQSEPDLPPVVRDKVATYLDETEKRLSVHKWSGVLATGLRYDSNANSGSNNVRWGDIVITPASGGPRKDHSLYAMAAVEHSYEFQDRTDVQWESGALYYGTRYEDLHASNLNYINVTTGPRLTVFEDLLPATTVRPYVIGTLITVAGDPYGYSPGLGLNLRSQLTDADALELTGESRRRHFHVSEDRPVANEQQGYESVLRGQIVHRLTPAVALLGSLGYGRTTAAEGYNGFSEYSADAGVSVNYDGPLGALPWTSSLSGRRAYTLYDSPDEMLTPGRLRRDRDWRFTLTTMVPIDQQWSAVMTLGRSVRSSTIENFRYENSFASIGAQWSF